MLTLPRMGSRASSVDVNLGTVEGVEEILRDAGVPVSRYFLRQRLAEQGRSTTPARLNRALSYLFRHELAIEGSKGVQWTFNPSAKLRRAIANGRRL